MDLTDNAFSHLVLIFGFILLKKMSSNLLNWLKKLIELKTFSHNLSSIQEKFNKNTKNVLNFESNIDSVIDGIKVCRSDLKIIESNPKPKKLKCFWPKCHFKTNYR